MDQSSHSGVRRLPAGPGYNADRGFRASDLRSGKLLLLRARHPIWKSHRAIHFSTEYFVTGVSVPRLALKAPLAS